MEGMRVKESNKTAWTNIKRGMVLPAIIRVGTPWMNFFSDEILEVCNGY